MGDVNIDLGCGQKQIEGYIGLDQHEAIGEWANVDIVCDLTQGIPLEDESVDKIYSGHFFEHLGKFEVEPMLAECQRVLKPGGEIEIIVPDLDKVLDNFIDAPLDKKYGWPLDTVFGGQAHEGEYHKTGFWPQLFYYLFEKQGFRDANVEEMEGWGQPCLRATAKK